MMKCVRSCRMVELSTDCWSDTTSNPILAALVLKSVRIIATKSASPIFTPLTVLSADESSYTDDGTRQYNQGNPHPTGL
jgi:hypothetical protein